MTVYSWEGNRGCTGLIQHSCQFASLETGNRKRDLMSQSTYVTATLAVICM